MNEQYDLFISYSHKDKQFVQNWLLPRLEAEGFTVCIDYRDFEVGAPILENMERAVDRSLRTIAVLTPDWIRSQWTEFESLLVRSADPAARKQRLLPLMLKKCAMPPRITMLTYSNFCEPQSHEKELRNLLGQLRPKHTDDYVARRPGKPLIAITMGDANGIGPQVVLKALRSRCSAREICIPVVIGSHEHLKRERKALENDKYSIPELVTVKKAEEACDNPNAIYVLDVGPSPDFKLTDPREPNPDIAKLSEQYTRHAVELAMHKDVAAIVSAPVSKEAALAAGTTSRGHAELIAGQLGKDTHAMFLSADIAVSVVTNHLPLEEALALLTKERIINTIVQAAKQFRIWRPEAELKIGVCSVDPHAGEGGLLGTQDKYVVKPAVDAARQAIFKENYDARVDGPRPVDVLFRPQVRTSYTLIVALYHDQAKAAVAALGSNDFIAALAGGGIIRTTTTHGTAFDIAGRTTASSANLLRAIEQASYLSPEGTEYLLSSPDIHATKRYDIESRLNRATAAKNQLGEKLRSLDSVKQFLSVALGHEEFRICFGPGSTPKMVAVHLLAWVRKFADTLTGVEILTNNLLIVDYVRTLGSDFLRSLWLFGREWNRKNDSLSCDGHVAETIEQFKPHISVISCSGVTFKDGQARFYAYNADHAKTLRGIIEGHVNLDNGGNKALLVVVATGGKLGREISDQYASCSDLPAGATLLLEQESKVRAAVGKAKINELIEGSLAGDDDS